MERIESKRMITRDEILEFVQTKCPEAVAALPPKETFIFGNESYANNINTTPRLEVGYRKLLRPVRTEPVELYFINMNHSPWVVYISNGVFLKTTKQFDRVHFNEPFSHLGSYPFSYTIRAFAIFILVLCEKWTQFVNFGKGEGLEALEYALNAIHAGTLEPNPISQNLASPQVQDDSPIPMIKKAKGSRPDTEKKVAAEACKGEEDRIKPSKSLQNKSERTQIMKEARETTLIKTKNATMEAQHGTKRSLAEFLADNDN